MKRREVIDVLTELETCTRAWEPAACLVGNVTADEVVRACEAYRKRLAEIRGGQRAHAGLVRDYHSVIGESAVLRRLLGALFDALTYEAQNGDGVHERWHDAYMETKAMLKTCEAPQRAELDSRLGDALRASGINSDDALAVQSLYAVAGQSGSHRIVSAMRAVEAWIRDGGAL